MKHLYLGRFPIVFAATGWSGGLRTCPLLLLGLLLTGTIAAADPTATPSSEVSEGPVLANSNNDGNILTLRECITHAIGNSAKLAAERHKLAAMASHRKATLWKPFSNFSVRGSLSMVPDKCAQLNNGILGGCDETFLASETDYQDRHWGPSFHLRIGGAIPIPVSSKIKRGKEALDHQLAAKKAVVPSLKNEIRYNVHQAFHAITGAREMLYTLTQGREHLTTARKKIETNLENQEGTETEIDLVKLKVYDAQLDAMEQEALLIEQDGLAALNFLVGAHSDAPVDIPSDPQEQTIVKLKPMTDYLEAAIHNRPELEALRHAVKAHRANVKFRRSELAPDLAFVITFRWGHTPGVRFSQNNTTSEGTTVSTDSMPYVYRDTYNYGSIVPGMALVMNYPLNFGETTNQLDKAKAEMAAMVADQKHAVEGITLEVKRAYLHLTAIDESIDALNRSRRLARGWLFAAVQNLSTGIGQSKDVSDALKEYFKIMAQIHQKIAEYNIGLAKLEQASGIILTHESSH